MRIIIRLHNLIYIMENIIIPIYNNKLTYSMGVFSILAKSSFFFVLQNNCVERTFVNHR